MEPAQILKTEPNPNIPPFGPGDTVRVNFRIREGERERIQAFQGVVIRLANGKGPAANFTVRRITAGIGIERIFPIHSPLIESLEVTRRGSVRPSRSDQRKDFAAPGAGSGNYLRVAASSAGPCSFPQGSSYSRVNPSSRFLSLPG